MTGEPSPHTEPTSPAPSYKTPPRNNYANPHTPIMSAKRPRSSLQRAASKASDSSSTKTPTASSSAGKDLSSPDNSFSPMHTKVVPVRRDNGEKDGMVVKKLPPQKLPLVNSHDDEDKPDSPSSTASWVGRKVDALFSPVLRLLEHQSDAADDLAVSTTDTDTNPSSTASAESPDSMVITEDTAADDEGSIHSSDSVLTMEAQTMPEEDSEEFNPWQFIQSLPPYAHVKHLCPPVALPPKEPDAPPITLVLDLDETLVHCSVEPVEGADLDFPVDFHGTTYQVHVRLRPFLFPFLAACADKFEVVLFTASQKIYANELLNRIDPKGIYIKHRLYRESCLAVEGNFLKDLNVLGRDLSQTILVDNSPHAFGYQVDNGIPIESWFDDPKDKELLKLERFLLHKCHGTSDVRTVLRNKFRCQELVDNAPPFYA